MALNRQTKRPERILLVRRLGVRGFSVVVVVGATVVVVEVDVVEAVVVVVVAAGGLVVVVVVAGGFVGLFNGVGLNVTGR